MFQIGDRCFRYMLVSECGMYLKLVNSQFATFKPAMAMSRDGDLYTSVFTQIECWSLTSFKLKSEILPMACLENVSCRKIYMTL